MLEYDDVCKECGVPIIYDEGEGDFVHIFADGEIDEERDMTHRPEPDNTCHECGRPGMFCLCDAND